MSTSLLSTKLCVPPVSPSVVLRSRLIERLDEGLAHKLTLLSAPAGFGKTTLLSNWIHTRNQAVAWISLDTSDNDPLRFLSYVIAALQNIGSHRFIIDFLGEEVLQQQSERVRAFLLQKSILERLTPPLCDAVTQEQNGQQTLEDLERTNLFIVPLDDERRWYRYHRLFADLLRHHMQRTYPDLAGELHYRAARWFEQEGDVSEAIKHFVQSKNYGDTARLVEANGMTLLSRGQPAELLNWMELIPEPYFARRPWLAICHAWALLLTGQVKSVEPRLQTVEHAPNAVSTVEPQEEMGHIAAIRAYAAALRGDVQRAIELAQVATEQLPVEALSVQSVVALTLAGARMMAEDLQGAEVAFARAAKSGQEAGNVHVAVPALVAVQRVPDVHQRLPKECTETLFRV